MSKEQPVYSKIFKNVILFGGVQIVQVLATVARGKFVALFLGTTGIGINAMFNSVILMLVQFSGMGIQYSAVREISAAAASDNKVQLQQTIQVFRSWILASAVLGGVLTFILSGMLSQFSFGNNSYQTAFLIAAIVVALNVLNNGNIALLQGTQRLSKMALVTVFSAVASLITSVPIYYAWGQKGIIPAIMVAAMLSFSISWFYSRPFIDKSRRPSISFLFRSGRSMVGLGILMMIATLLGTAATYLINAFIRTTGSLNDVGLYSAGISITNQYVGVIFTALAADYFPKLAAIASNNNQVKLMVNTQSEIVMLVSAPIVAGMMLTAPLLIRILLSGSFLSITGFVQWAAFAMFLKAASFSAGYISFAKGDKKTFFLFEGIIGSSLILITSVIGYWIGGVEGVAKGILVNYVLYLFTVHWLSNWRYQYKPGKAVIMLFVKLALLLLGILLSLLLLPRGWDYAIGSVLLFIVLYVSYTELDNRIMLQKLMRARLKR